MELADMNPPRHNVLDSQFSAEGSKIVVMCNGVKFFIEVRAKDLKDTIFASQHRRLVEPLQKIEDDDEKYEDMCDWMVRPCFLIFKEFALQSPPLNLTLREFYFPRTLRLRLFVRDQSLVPRKIAGRLPTISKSLTIRSAKLPPFPEVPRIRASSITIVPDTETDDHLCEIPRKVLTADGTECYFKPAFDQSQYIREVDKLTEVSRASLSHLKISKLVGIVISDDARLTLGLVVEWIPSLWNLQNVGPGTHQSFYEKWEQQVTATVQRLHRNGIIWGDVHPGNIVIDKKYDAWVVDFGGGWVEPFVTRKSCGTVHGDLRGITRVFEHLQRGESCEFE